MGVTSAGLSWFQKAGLAHPHPTRIRAQPPALKRQTRPWRAPFCSDTGPGCVSSALTYQELWQTLSLNLRTILGVSVSIPVGSGRLGDRGGPVLAPVFRPLTSARSEVTSTACGLTSPTSHLPRF